MKATEISVGTILPNGASAIEMYVVNLSEGVVLAENHRGEYVTWLFGQNDLATTYSGHYFDDLKEARVDFNNRLWRLIGRTK